MPIQTYETLFLLDSTKLSADPDGIKTGLQHTIEKMGGKIVIARNWDDRKLAYPIEKQKKGSYFIVYFTMESRSVPEYERELKLNENILRQMTLHIDSKWEEAILDVAKNDQSPAFALRGMQEEASPSDMNPALGESVPMGEAVAAAQGGRRRHRDSGAEKPE